MYIQKLVAEEVKNTVSCITIEVVVSIRLVDTNLFDGRLVITLCIQ